MKHKQHPGLAAYSADCPLHPELLTESGNCRLVSVAHPVECCNEVRFVLGAARNRALQPHPRHVEATLGQAGFVFQGASDPLLVRLRLIELGAIVGSLDLDQQVAAVDRLIVVTGIADT